MTLSRSVFLFSLVARSRRRLTPQKLSDRNANHASSTQAFCRRSTTPRRAKKTTWHRTELIDDSLGYATHAGSRRNEESWLLFERRAGPGADLDSCLLSHVDNGAICSFAFTGRITVISHPQTDGGRERERDRGCRYSVFCLFLLFNIAKNALDRCRSPFRNSGANPATFGYIVRSIDSHFINL